MTFSSALVTGASGFIGRVLVRHLLDRGVGVTCLGRPNSAVPAGATVIRVSHLQAPALASSLAGFECDVVFHLAAYGVAPGDRDPATMFATNVAGTTALVEQAASLRCRAFVYAGSCSEYATSLAQRPIDENFPLNHDALYGASKAAGGLWGQALGSALGVPFQWLRLFGVYGPGEAPHRLLPHLAARLRRDERVPLTPGEQWRDFLHVDDVARGLIIAADAALAGRLGPFNLCSGQGITVGSAARQVAEIVGKPESLLEFGAMPYRPGEPLWLVGKPDRFSEASGFRPEISFESGLSRSLEEL